MRLRARKFPWGRVLATALGTVAFSALVGVGVAAASATECDWEWGGVVEVTPEPCSTPGTVTVEPGATPLPVAIETPLDVAVVLPDPLPVSDAGGGGGAIDLAPLLLLVSVIGGLGMFLLSAHVVASWRK